MTGAQRDSLPGAICPPISGVRRVTLTALVSLCVLAGGLSFAATPGQAFITHDYLSQLTGFTNPVAIAVDSSSDVYVVDEGTGLVNRFGSSGAPLPFSASEPYVEGAKLKGTPTGAGGAVVAFGDPRGIAVDDTTGDVYVADSALNVVDVFASSGEYLSQLTGTPPSAPVSGAFAAPSGLAVDQATGNLYVSDGGNGVVDVFNSSREYVSQFGNGVPPGLKATVGVNDFTEDVYAFNGRIAVSVFNPLGESLAIWEGNGLGYSYDYVTVDQTTGHVYVAVRERGSVDEFSGASPTQELLGSISGTPAGPFGNEALAEGNKAPMAVATNPVNGDLYVAEGGVVDIFGPDVVLPDEVTGGASSVVSTGATLSGTVNPDGVAVTACEFEYGTDTSYGHTVACSTNPGSGSSPVAVSAQLAGLQQNTTYHYRLAASNANGKHEGADGTFTTLGSPRVDSESAEVNPSEPAGQTTAALGAQITPDSAAGHETTYYFQYGESTSYGTNIPVPPGDIGSGESPVSVPAAELSGLKIGTTYHYRVVASNEYGTTYGLDETFKTLQAVSIDSEFATSVSATSVTFGAQLNPLGVSATYRIEYGTTSEYGQSTPDGSLSPVVGDVAVSAHVDGLLPDTLYHYRVVAHDEREGVSYTVEGPDETFSTQHLGGPLVLPDGRAWELVSPADMHGAKIFELPHPAVQQLLFLSQASASGDAVTYMTNSPTELNPPGFQFVVPVLSRHGAGGWSSRDLTTPTEVPVGENQETEDPLFSQDLSSQVVQQWGLNPPLLSPLASERTPYLRRDGLCESQASAGECYEPLISGKEGVADVPQGTQFGYIMQHELAQDLSLEGATPDLTHVVFRYLGGLHEASLTSTPAPGGGLYEWSADKPPAERLQLVSVLPEGKGNGTPEASLLGGPGAGFYAQPYSKNAISSDGSRVFWSGAVKHELGVYMRDMVKGETLEISPNGRYQNATTDGSKVFFTEGGDFKECEIVEEAGKLKCKYTDLMPGAGATLFELGSSADGSYVYFTTANDSLYVRHEGVTKLITEDIAPKEEGLGGEEPEQDQLEMSPDGQFVAFMSKASPTGYDNVDLATGQPDAEVYVYDARSGHLACASCNPSGARPQLGGGWVPGWTTRHHQPAYLSDGGRLFFNTAEALVPQDINGTTDVYEFEPAGAGSCTSAGPTFTPGSGGCVGLISSGVSAEESTFLDASESGDDVFFVTQEKLVPQDVDTAVDVYDAHVCSSGWPCASPQGSVPECTTTDACRAAPLQQPSIFGASASATFSGAGNVVPMSTSVVKPKTKPLTRAQKLNKALKTCKKDRPAKRKTCAKQARKAYGAKVKSKSHKGGK